MWGFSLFPRRQEKKKKVKGRFLITGEAAASPVPNDFATHKGLLFIGALSHFIVEMFAVDSREILSKSKKSDQTQKAKTGT